VRERPAADQPLRGVRVLVTRPAQQAEGLARLIEQTGGAAIRLPTIEIAEPRDGAALARLIERLDEFDLAIFISPNAVRLGLARVLARGPLPERLEVAAVGQASAAELRRLGVRDVLAHVGQHRRVRAAEADEAREGEEVDGEILGRGELQREARDPAGEHGDDDHARERAEPGRQEGEGEGLDGLVLLGHRKLVYRESHSSDRPNSRRSCVECCPAVVPRSPFLKS